MKTYIVKAEDSKIRDYSSSFPKWFIGVLNRYSDLKSWLNNKHVDLERANFIEYDGGPLKLSDPNLIPVFEFDWNTYVKGYNDNEQGQNQNTHQWRAFRYWSKKDLMDQANHIGYIDISDASNSNLPLQTERAKAKKGAEEWQRGRGQYRYEKYATNPETGEYEKSGEYEWLTERNEDKSGYNIQEVHKKLMKRLSQADLMNYQSKLDYLYGRLEMQRKVFADHLDDFAGGIKSGFKRGAFKRDWNGDFDYAIQCLEDAYEAFDRFEKKILSIVSDYNEGEMSEEDANDSIKYYFTYEYNEIKRDLERSQEVFSDALKKY